MVRTTVSYRVGDHHRNLSLVMVMIMVMMIVSKALKYTGLFFFTLHNLSMYVQADICSSSMQLVFEDCVYTRKQSCILVEFAILDKKRQMKLNVICHGFLKLCVL